MPATLAFRLHLALDLQGLALDYKDWSSPPRKEVLRPRKDSRESYRASAHAKPIRFAIFERANGLSVRIRPRLNLSGLLLRAGCAGWNSLAG